MRPTLRSVSLATALAALAPLTPVSAQSNNSAEPPIDVPPGTELAPIVVTATRTGDGVRADQLGASVTVIEPEQMEQRQTRIVSDVLRDVPGVAISRTGAIGGLTQIRLRGTEGNQTLVLIDGIKASDPYYGEYDFGTLIADDASRVEVLRGQQSSLYGSDAIGGVVQYFTLSGAEAPGVRARFEAGSFGTASASVRSAGVKGDLDYAVSATTYNTDGSPTSRFGSRDVGSDSFGTSAKLKWKATPQLVVTGVARYSYTDADTNNSDSNPASPTFGYTIDSPGVHYKNEAIYGLVQADHTSLDGRWTNSLQAQVADTTRKGFDASGFDYGDKGKRYKGSFVSALRFGSDAVKQRATVAIDREREEFQNTTPGASVFQGRRGTNNLGLVGQYEAVILDALSLGASLRHDDNDRFDNVTTYRVQASYALPTRTRLHGAYGTGVKNPGYYELYGYSDGRYIGNPNLKPEKSKGWEAGIEQELLQGRVVFGATYFDSRLTDEIYTTYPAPSYVATPSNRLTESTQQGWEVSASVRPSKQFRVDAAYTYLRARENRVVEVRRPESIASLAVTASSADQKLSGTLTVRYNGRQTDVAYTDPSYVPVRVQLKSYTLVNVGAEYKLSPTVSLYGRIENALNEDYEEVFSFATPGRAGYAGVRFTF